ncbi:MAG: stage III sporulation protein AC [Clostridia bacterium]|nr:stage III sporulation protein AC [Clostridia bacterium]
MDVDLIFRIAGVGIVVAVLNQLLIRSGREEQALLTTIAGLVVVLYVLTREIGNLFEVIKQIFNL